MLSSVSQPFIDPRTANNEVENDPPSFINKTGLQPVSRTCGTISWVFFKRLKKGSKADVDYYDFNRH